MQFKARCVIRQEWAPTNGSAATWPITARPGQSPPPVISLGATDQIMLPKNKEFKVFIALLVN